MKKWMIAGCVILSMLLCACMGPKEPQPVNVTEYDLTLQLNFGTSSGIYTGEMLSELPNGKGKFETQNSSGEKYTYEGDWINGHFSGQGKIIFEDGTIYQGKFENDELNGVGSDVTADGKYKYEGQYKDGIHNGQGKYYFENKLIYEGDFLNGLYNGEGKYYDKKGNVTYEGTFVNMLPEEAQFKETCKTEDYKDTARNPDAYYNKPMKYKGKVVQVMESENKKSVNYRIAVNNDYSSIVYGFYTHKENEARILEDDTVTIWGFGQGTVTYESTNSGMITIPAMDICYTWIH